AAAKDIRLHDVLVPLEPSVNGDPGRLQQVLGNLLDNAVKFTPRGGAIEVTLRQEGSRAEIVVSDTGKGIATDRLPHVFDRAQPREGGGASASPGLGVGLALVRHLVELHGGSVFVESAGPAHGSTFVVELPLGGASAPMRPVLPDRAATPTPAALHGVRILLVDDNPAVVQPVAEALAHAGGDVRGCESADAALDVLAAWQPDVIVSDVQMPGDDGYAFVRAVRALAPEQGGRTPVIALTALNRTEDRIRSLTAGFNMHVPKPVDPAELTTIVASLARLTRQGETAWRTHRRTRGDEAPWTRDHRVSAMRHRPRRPARDGRSSRSSTRATTRWIFSVRRWSRRDSTPWWATSRT